MHNGLPSSYEEPDDVDEAETEAETDTEDDGEVEYMDETEEDEFETESDTEEEGEYVSESEDEDKSGIVYLATGPRVDMVKVGYWKGAMKALESRYKTYFGDDVEIHVYHVLDCVKIERIFLKQFSSCRLSDSSKRELFDKKYLRHYKTVLSAIEANVCSQ